MMGTIETHVFRSDMLFKTFRNGKEVTRPNTLLVQMMRTPKGTLVRIKGNKIHFHLKKRLSPIGDAIFLNGSKILPTDTII